MGEMGKVHVGLVGALGKMGRMIQEVIEKEDDISVSVQIDPLVTYDRTDKKNIYLIDVPDLVDVIIDFSNPLATMETAIWCVQNKKPLVSGTTGLSIGQLLGLKAYAEHIAFLSAPNMSLGVNLIDALLPQLKLLGEFDIEIVETHHRLKKDSPSGTALRWAKTLAQVFGRKVVNSRQEGVSQGRDKEEIYVHAMRGGTVPGEHTIYFFGPDEVIEITHRAASRLIFAKGAVMAAKWIIGQPPGLYSMNNVLGL
ncbi:MAG: 4-hydroxy-tetrahydrodipicolinate reductase [Candidatus Buchananbacteria bacterium RBG_13_39_9]|uniref:4-hydroxy-tetrahydrodipicolinate reductase n=1 Tax=Candidatus Buchananbacteria bacterium RBG_13_39_9 TaxID=1797531 RepID=A0A1G1XPS0_9BACT|nr:MAG: 4-hydroxy-tetrahydrodipicolinate reductase [Candidatus Buchananbacteria bacterium RBG_13_39_9]